MSHFGNGVEIGLHCLLHLVAPTGIAGDVHGGTGPERRWPGPSTRDLAEFQGVSPSFTAKIFTQLEKAGIVRSVEGVRGGFALARPADEITVLDVTDAIEGQKKLFQCRDIRDDCILYRDGAPKRARDDVCSIHALMIEAESRMRETLAVTTLADLAETVAGKMPKKRLTDGTAWFETRLAGRARGQAARYGSSRKEKRT